MSEHSTRQAGLVEEVRFGMSERLSWRESRESRCITERCKGAVSITDRNPQHQ